MTGEGLAEKMTVVEMNRNERYRQKRTRSSNWAVGTQSVESRSRLAVVVDLTVLGNFRGGIRRRERRGVEGPVDDAMLISSQPGLLGT